MGSVIMLPFCPWLGRWEKITALPPAVRPVPTVSRGKGSAVPLRPAKRESKKVLRLGRLPESCRLSAPAGGRAAWG